MGEKKRSDPVPVPGDTLHSAERATTDPARLGNATTVVAETSHVAPVQLAEIEQDDEALESRYETLHVLGHGGMGEVRVCRDRRIGREVAVKVVHQRLGSRGDLKARFLREARVQGQLEHPSVVPVYDLGRGPDGEPYFTMKRVRGHTLEKIIEALRSGDEQARKKYSPRKLLGAVASICLALDYVHERGVVHRDLKPANVILGDFGEVYLLDWGLAKLVGAPEIDDERRVDPAVASSEDRAMAGPSVLTSVNTLLGTPGYMAREQLLGNLLDIDGRADIYALGAILFELLTLERLHGGETMQDVLKSTMDGAVARPSVRAPAREVPPELEAICVKATATVPSDRYLTAREMNDAIERYLDGDRDLQHRREMAIEHARAAERAAAAAETEDPEAAEASRRVAMRELSRAVALDPDNPRTMRAMVSLLMQAPRELPRDVKDELEALARDQVRLGGKTGGLVYLSILLYIPLTVLMGIRTPWLWGMFGLASVASVASFAVARVARPGTKYSMAVFVLSIACVGAMAGMFGPFVLVPAVAAASALIFSTTNDRSQRAFVIGFACLAVVVPFGLEQAGVVPPSMRFTEEGIVLLPRFFGFPALWSQVFVLVTSLAVIVTSGLALAPFRNELDDAQRRIRLLAWHLRQLVPEQATSDASDTRNTRQRSERTERPPRRT